MYGSRPYWWAIRNAFWTYSSSSFCPTTDQHASRSFLIDENQGNSSYFNSTENSHFIVILIALNHEINLHDSPIKSWWIDLNLPILIDAEID